ncbi:MAG: alpha/beta fold hydrolase [Verrucomicrobia bacterium]|nr:MAG: alpha/beta fold hydrolase [Verrucomicrobiota bacterium]
MKRWSLLFLYIGLLVLSHLVRDADGPVRPPRPGQAVMQIPETRGGEPTGRRITLAYRDTGAPEGGGGVRDPVVLLHGSPVATEAMEPLIGRLAGTARVIAPDLPGFGGSERAVADYSFIAHAHAVLALLDELGVERVHLAAYSMGGGVALEICRLAPRRVASVSMLSAIGVQELELLGDYGLNHLVHGLQYTVIRALVAGTPHFGWLDRFPLNLSYARNFLDSDQRPLRGILERLEQPVLIVHGREDFFVPPAAAREHARIVPQSRLVWLEGGHLLAITDPERVARPLVAFLRDVEAGRAAGRGEASPQRLAAAREPFDFRRHGVGGTGREVAGAVFLALATLASEDLACISGGLLAVRGALSWSAALLGCLGGIVVGDVLLFLAGRWLGPRALRRRPWRWFVSAAQVERCAGLFRRRGGMLVLLARFMPGLRLPTYFAAGAVGMGLGRFLGYFLGAAVLWTPLLVGAAALVGDRMLGWAEQAGGWGWMAALGGVAALWGGMRLATVVSTHRGRRLLYGWWRRKVRWEYWPAWALYPPVLVYIVWLGLRHRGLTVFTAANPGMPCGGLAGESKAAILGAFPPGLPELARFAVIAPEEDVEHRLVSLDRFMAANALRYPVVLKPDVGERGQGVSIVRTRTEAAAVLARCREALIAQAFVPGREFGLFYVRHPGAPRGLLISITAKEPTRVTGDGRRTLEELILDDDRAVCMAPFFFRKLADRLGEVPAAGEVVALSELGTHCRGALFLDGWDEVWSAALEARVDAVSRQLPGFYFGRFDVRTPSAEALREQGEFRILEVNGVTSESTHMYDPRYSVLQAWRILFTQWRLAFSIGAANRERGHRPASVREISRTIVGHLGREKFEA